MWAIQAQASDRRSRKKSPRVAQHHLNDPSLLEATFFALLHRLGPHPGGDARIARVTREI